MVTYTDDGVVYIDSPDDLEREMHRYNCKTKEELDDLLWFEYGVALVVLYD